MELSGVETAGYEEGIKVSCDCIATVYIHEILKSRDFQGNTTQLTQRDIK